MENKQVSQMRIMAENMLKNTMAFMEEAKKSAEALKKDYSGINAENLEKEIEAAKISPKIRNLQQQIEELNKEINTYGS